MRRGVNEVFVLLRCYTALTGSYRSFGTAYRPHGEGSGLTFEDGTDRLSQNYGNYQSTLCNIPEER